MRKQKTGKVIKIFFQYWLEEYMKLRLFCHDQLDKRLVIPGASSFQFLLSVKRVAENCLPLCFSVFLTVQQSIKCVLYLIWWALHNCSCLDLLFSIFPGKKDWPLHFRGLRRFIESKDQHLLWIPILQPFKIVLLAQLFTSDYVLFACLLRGTGML